MRTVKRRLIRLTLFLTKTLFGSAPIGKLLRTSLTCGLQADGLNNSEVQHLAGLNLIEAVPRELFPTH